jgi:hypothetical protein
VQFGVGLRKEVLNHHKTKRIFYANESRRNQTKRKQQTERCGVRDLNVRPRHRSTRQLVAEAPVSSSGDARRRRSVQQVCAADDQERTESIYWRPLNVFTMNRWTLQSDCVLSSGGHRMPSKRCGPVSVIVVGRSITNSLTSSKSRKLVIDSGQSRDRLAVNHQPAFKHEKGAAR